MKSWAWQSYQSSVPRSGVTCQCFLQVLQDKVDRRQDFLSYLRVLRNVLDG
jgi:hypothetical protein